MPLYEYQCEQCGATFEVIQKFSDAPLDTCRSCGGRVHRLLSAPAIQFKGSGWYITDYAKKGAGGADADKSTPAGGRSEGAPAAASDAKGPAAGPSTPTTSSAASSGDTK